MRETAAMDLACPADSLKIEEIEGRGVMGGMYLASGCERSDKYVADCNLFTCTSIREEEHARRKAEEEAAAAERRQAAAERAAAEPPKPKITHASVSLTNLCTKKVLLFRGRHPKNSGGMHDSLDANGSRSVPGNEGDMLWIIDEKGNPLSSHTFSPAVRKLYVLKSCTGFTTEP